MLFFLIIIIKKKSELAITEKMHFEHTGFSGEQELELGKMQEIQGWRKGPGEQAELKHM